MGLIEEIKTAEKNSTNIYSTGQAGFIIKNKNGNTIAIDLYLSDYVERIEESDGYTRLLPKILKPHDCTFDIIIATHPHGDHYDKDSMVELMENGKSFLIASVNCEEITKEQSIDQTRIAYMEPGDNISRSGFGIHTVDCDHGQEAPDAFGVVIEVDGIKVYEVGDSCFRPDYGKSILEQFGKIDVLIGPINGAFGNMNEEEFAQFIDVIKPELAIPCHYGMFEAHGGSPDKFKKIMREKYPKQKILVMEQGDKFTL